MNNLPSHSNASTHLSKARSDHREWIAGRAITLLSHYWRDDDPVELTAAIGADWADVLEGLPRDVIQRACVQFQRTENRRKPSPGAIYHLAKKMLPPPKPARFQESESALTNRAARNEKTPEQRREFTTKVFDDIGFKVRKFP